MSADPDRETCLTQTVQARLRDLQYSPGVVDNEEGPDTRAAVVRFKRQHGLAERPYIGPQTIALMFSPDAQIYQPPPAPDPGEAPWLTYALRFEGLKEIPGAEDNPQIVEWGQQAGIDWWNNDEDAWCAVFVNGALVNTGYLSTVSALAKSFQGDAGAFPHGYGTKVDPRGHLEPGTIVVFNRGTSTTSGHVAIVIEDQGANVLTINGNVSNMVKKSTYAKSTIVSAWYPDETCVAAAV